MLNEHMCDKHNVKISHYISKIDRVAYIQFPEMVGKMDTHIMCYMENGIKFCNDDFFNCPIFFQCEICHTQLIHAKDIDLMRQYFLLGGIEGICLFLENKNFIINLVTRRV